MSETSQPIAFRLQFQFSGDKPFQLIFESIEDEKTFRTMQEASKMRTGLFLYLRRLRELAQELIPEGLRAHLPDHYFFHTRVLINPCSDGIIIRYDPYPGSEHDEVFIVPSKQSIGAAIPSLSLGYIRIKNDSDDSKNGVENTIPPPPSVGLSIKNVNEGSIREIVKQQPVVMDVSLGAKDPEDASQRPEFAMHIQIRSRLEVGVEGVEAQAHLNVASGRSFEVRNAVKLPLYWDAISILPWAQLSVWREADFVRIADKHFYENAFQAARNQLLWLQKTSQARLREYYKHVVEEFSKLLERPDISEEILQAFLTRHPEVVSPGYKRVLPKQALGPHVTDFIIEERTGEYLLVELESPMRRLFKKDGHEAADLTHARGQIHDWIRYIQDNKSTVEKELKLQGISASPRSLIIIGRSNAVSAENRRKLQVGTDRIEVCTYDDLRDRFHVTVEAFVGLLSHVGQPYDVTYFSREKM